MSQSDEIVITPFEHQVGGHKVVLQISKTLICKPREDSEVEFYRRLPDHLKECVPHFKGNNPIHIWMIKMFYFLSLMFSGKHFMHT